MKKIPQPTKPDLLTTPEETWKDLSENQKRITYYFWHIQKARTLTEMAELLVTTTEELEGFAGQQALPVYDWTSELQRDRHNLLVQRFPGPDRPHRDDIYMKMAKLAATRGTCLAAQIGCVITVQNRVVVTGYNGAPAGKFHCTDTGICRKELLGFKHKDDSVPGQLGAAYEASRAVHAEQSAICQAARQGIVIGAGTIYVTREPCVLCMRMIVNCGLIKVMYLDKEGFMQSLDPLYVQI